MNNRKNKTARVVNLTFNNDSMVVDTFVKDVNLSLRKEFKLAKKPIDLQFKSRINEYIDQLNSLNEEELLENLEIIKSVYINKIIRPTLIELLTNSEDKNLYTSLKLDLYNLTLEDVIELQQMINNLNDNIDHDQLVYKFANLIFTYITYKIAQKRAKLLDNVRF